MTQARKIKVHSLVFFSFNIHSEGASQRFASSAPVRRSYVSSTYKKVQTFLSKRRIIEKIMTIIPDDRLPSVR
ncbi:hypothetical protein GE061_017729 [Apolygus lucorum]|uniref:Uncharacterized protein n=1 Tax=Apolygus lucorum TaxID=248454 RepID=A0A8S9XEH3_APOLU|nr:hypothetical protein GE061_017729 [Apolygus lucorum]